MLDAAGLTFDVAPADVDERAIRETLQADDSGIDPADVAEVLARAKAETISRQRPDALVIGADQVLALGDEIFE
jgi:septum formation protein